MCRQLSRGFTLIEVLVTLVILTFGLLGIAGLMAKGQRASFEAYQRQAALAIANDMAERMRSNRSQAPVYALIVSHIFSWTRDEVYFNLFSCWLRAVIFPKRCLREFVCG